MWYRHHLGVDEESLPKEAYEAICALTPEARKHYGFHLQLDTDVEDGGEVVRKIITIFAQHGLGRRQAVGKGAYKHTVHRAYEDELFNFDLLLLNSQIMTRTGVKDGRFVGAADSEYKLMSTLGFSHRINKVFVSEDVRKLLEREKFVGLEFGDSSLYPETVYGRSADVWLELKRASQRWAVLPGPFWELKSSVVLPKIANRLMQYGWRNEPPRPFEGDYSRQVFIHDPPFNRGEIHYRRSEIEALGSFDIARTYEKFMGPEGGLVFSQRVYRYCLTNGIGVWVYPVRIDSE